MNNIEVLKQMRAELAQRIDALDSAIRILEQIHNDDLQIKIEEPSEPKMYRGKTRNNVAFESAIDFTKLQEPASPWTCPKCGALNPAGSSSCMECKTKKAGVSRKDK